jgi:hypothetical protein
MTHNAQHRVSPRRTSSSCDDAPLAPLRYGRTSMGQGRTSQCDGEQPGGTLAPPHPRLGPHIGIRRHAPLSGCTSGCDRLREFLGSCPLQSGPTVPPPSHLAVRPYLAMRPSVTPPLRMGELACAAHGVYRCTSAFLVHVVHAHGAILCARAARGTPWAHEMT